MERNKEGKFIKGKPKTGGRKKGVTNKKLLLDKAISSAILKYTNKELNAIEDFTKLIYAIILKNGIKSDNPDTQLKAAFELLPYVQPRKKTANNDIVTPQPEITEPGFKHPIDKLLKPLKK